LTAPLAIPPAFGKEGGRRPRHEKYSCDGEGGNDGKKSRRLGSLQLGMVTVWWERGSKTARGWGGITLASSTEGYDGRKGGGQKTCRSYLPDMRGDVLADSVEVHGWYEKQTITQKKPPPPPERTKKKPPPPPPTTHPPHPPPPPPPPKKKTPTKKKNEPPPPPPPKKREGALGCPPLRMCGTGTIRLSEKHHVLIK